MAESLLNETCYTIQTIGDVSDGNQSCMTILDGTFFEIVKHKTSQFNQVVARCVKCEPAYTEIKGHSTSSSNFVGHLKRKHGSEVLNQYREYINTKKKKNSPHDTINQISKCIPESISQEQFENNITKFVVNTMIPLKVVDDPSFHSIFEDLGIENLNIKIISRRTLCRRIETLYKKNVEYLREQCKETSFVCTTADIWSGRRRSFLGVTVHWITDNLERKSAALACSRFQGSHSYDRIAELLEEIHLEFRLTYPKIRATVTDNGSNFIKAFKVYGVNSKSIQSPDNNDDGFFFNSGSDEDSDDELENSQTLNNCFMETTPRLPQHIKCCAHTLNLCASTDIPKAICKSDVLFNLHKKIMSKCNALWKAGSRPRSAEQILTILGHTISRPGETRWNSLYDSLTQIIQIKEKISQIYEELNLKCSITESEFLYIQEHLDCAKPVADALDILQGDTHAYYGITIPTLVALRRKLEILCDKQWVFCKPIADAFLKCVNERFYDFFNFTNPESLNAGIAALCHPKFKKRWLSCVDPQHHNTLLSALKETVAFEMISDENDDGSDLRRNELSDSTVDFFDFGEENTAENNSLVTRAEIQIFDFFRDPGQRLNSLHNYPEVKKVFVKYNTPLPSSAPVERLFSYATMTNLPKSNKLSDKNFEKRVLLKANSKFIF